MNDSLKKRDSYWSVPFVMLMAITFFDTLAFMMMRAILTQYASDIGIAADAAGIIVGAMFVAALLMRPVAGALIDRFNNKRLMTIAYIGAVITTILYFFADSFWPLLLVRMMNGMCYGLSAVATMTIVGTLIPEKKLGTGLAMYGMGLVVSVTFSSAIAAWLYGFGINVVFGASLTCVSISLIVSFFVPNVKREMRSGKFDLKSTLKGLFAREAVPMSILSMLFMLGQSAMSAFLFVYFNIRNGTGPNIGNLSLFYLFWGFALFFARPLAGKLFDKWGLVPTAVLCLTCYGIYTISIALTQSPVLSYAVAILGSFGFGGSVPVLQAAAFKSVGPARKGSANSTHLIGSDLGAALGGFIYGKIIVFFAVENNPAFSYQLMYIFAAIPIVIGIFFCFFIKFREKRRSSLMKSQAIPSETI